jgi:hypothetical protein
MQVTLAETEQSDENEVARLTVDRMLNHIRELVLSTTDRIGNSKPYEMMKGQSELDVRSAEAAAYFNNHENLGEDMELEKNIAEFEVLEVAAYDDITEEVIKIVKKCIKCHSWKCKIKC